MFMLRWLVLLTHLVAFTLIIGFFSILGRHFSSRPGCLRSGLYPGAEFPLLTRTGWDDFGWLTPRTLGNNNIT